MSLISSSNPGGGGGGGREGGGGGRGDGEYDPHYDLAHVMYTASELLLHCNFTC